MPSAIVAGGGLAGLAAAAALGEAGYHVDLFEARPFLGGRATSYEFGSERIDNCQHVLLRCFTNLMDFYRRLGVQDRVRFHRKFYFVEPGGRVSEFGGGRLRSFARLQFLSLGDKIAIARALLALKRERRSRTDLDAITMLDWLREKRQPERAIRRFWGQVLVSAVNEDLDHLAARHGFQVFWEGFLARANSYEMGLAAVPLGELYGPAICARMPNVAVHVRAAVERIVVENGSARAVLVNGEEHGADVFVCAVPFERVAALAPEIAPPDVLDHSPITGIHLWFDSRVMDLPHATLLDRTIQWAFNKADGRYIQVVVSASRSLVPMPRADVVALAVRELGEFFPRALTARIEKCHVVKEVKATFSARPGLESVRPPARTAVSNLFLAGDWTRTGWPATMEGAVRSGYLAAEAVTGKRILR